MRYVVTGGAGFIGSNTVDELVKRGHSVVVLDDLSAGKEENLAEIRNKITFIKGSITDIEVVRKAMHEADLRSASRRAHVGSPLRERSDRLEHDQHRRHAQRSRRRARRQSEAHRFCRVVLCLRRNRHASQSRNHAARADFSLRRHKICR